MASHEPARTAMRTATRFTRSGVRLRRHPRHVESHPEAVDWLLLPGGPGIGSESLHELADAITWPGALWLVDLPGDGSNVTPPGAGPDPFAAWPDVIVEAAEAVPDAIILGHSTGGMYLLATPALEALVRGLVLVSTAPDARWRPQFIEMTQRHPLAAVDAATAAYEAEPTDARLRDLAVASTEWNFTADGVAAGRDLLSRMPYNGAAVAWSARQFDDTYVATWWPRALPTLVISGGEDRIVDQTLWDDPRFAGPHVTQTRIAGGGHFPWIEQPKRVGAALDAFAAAISAHLHVISRAGK